MEHIVRFLTKKNATIFYIAILLNIVSYDQVVEAFPPPQGGENTGQGPHVDEGANDGLNSIISDAEGLEDSQNRDHLSDDGLGFSTNVCTVRGNRSLSRIGAIYPELIDIGAESAIFPGSNILWHANEEETYLLIEHSSDLYISLGNVENKEEIFIYSIDRHFFTLVRKNNNSIAFLLSLPKEFDFSRCYTELFGLNRFLENCQVDINRFDQMLSWIEKEYIISQVESIHLLILILKNNNIKEYFTRNVFIERIRADYYASGYLDSMPNLCAGVNSRARALNLLATRRQSTALQSNVFADSPPENSSLLADSEQSFARSAAEKLWSNDEEGTDEFCAATAATSGGEPTAGGGIFQNLGDEGHVQTEPESTDSVLGSYTCLDSGQGIAGRDQVNRKFYADAYEWCDENANVNASFRRERCIWKYNGMFYVGRHVLSQLIPHLPDTRYPYSNAIPSNSVERTSLDSFLADTARVGFEAFMAIIDRLHERSISARDGMNIAIQVLSTRRVAADGLINNNESSDFELLMSAILNQLDLCFGQQGSTSFSK